MRTDIHIGMFDLFIFLGVFQGIFLSWFFIRNGMKGQRSNMYQGVLILMLSLAIFEELLNNTGLIVRTLFLSNFSEPFNFAFAPLFYLYLRSSLNPGEKQKAWPHFIVPAFWTAYLVFHIVQPDALKYNSYLSTKHPGWEYLEYTSSVSEDPLGIRRYTNELTLLSFLVYMPAAIILLVRKARSMGEKLFRTRIETFVVLRNTTLHFLAIIIIFLITKLTFGMGSDVGGYWIAAYISLMIYATSFQVINRSDFFDHPQSFLDFPLPKYQKSSLSDQDKMKILEKIRKEMEENRYYTHNLASLSGLAKKINESGHHVSQAINEKLGKNFYELMASYRVDQARELILQDKEGRLTVEELAERVGYNSKSSFNTAFKKITGMTPSEFRRTIS